MTDRMDHGRRAELNDASVRKDYGPAGCAGVVLGAVAVLVSLLKAARR